MPVKTIVNLTSADDTYTAAVGDYEINGVGGNDTVTTGAGNSSVNTGVGNSTITTGAGDSLVHTLDGNQTITTGAGDSLVSTGAGNSTITTGAGVNIVLTGNGNNTITTGAGASHITTGTGLGDDTITAGAGDAVVDSGLGNDTVTTAAGNDLVSYHVTGNTGMHSVFNGGTGIDTLNLAMTRAEWMSNAVQTDVDNYLDFLAANKGANGEDSAAAYTFKAFGLTASMFEKLRVTVDGVILQDATNSTVALHNDVISTTEKVASVAFNVLANDAVPDLIKSFSFINPAHGSVHLDAAYLDTASSPSAQFIYTPTAGFYNYLAVGESASDAFTYTVTDAAGGVSTATVIATINGTNDAPVITNALLIGAVTEKVTATAPLTSTGKINFSDVDLSDVHTVTSAASSIGTLGTLTASVTNDDSHTTGLGGQVTWAYGVDNAKIQYLAAGESKVETFTVTLSDGHGGVVPSTVSVTIVGTNEAPVITSGAQTGSVSASGGQPASGLTTTGHVTYSDVDLIDTHVLSISTLAAHGSARVNTQGDWSYTLKNDMAVSALTVGQHLNDSFTVLVDDLHGGKASQVVSIDITNPNHAPVANPDVGVSINSDGSVPVSLTTSGTAYQNGAGSSEYVITQALNNQVGALWSNTKVSLDKSFSVSAELYFGNISNGADGFSFIMQNQSKSIVGQAGEGLGYAGISNSVGVAFDTYYNAGTIDIRPDHTEINTGGRMNGVGGVHVLGSGNVKDGKYHAANIDWDASTQKLRVSFDGVQTDNQQLDLASLIGSKEAYVGFAGSTGGLYNLQKINTLSYHSTDNSVVLDVLANDTDVDPGDKVGLKVVSASSEHGATVSFSGLTGTGITYSPGHLFDNLALGQKDTDVIHYTIEDSHGAMSSSMDTVTIVGVAHHA